MMTTRITIQAEISIYYVVVRWFCALRFLWG